MLELEEAEVEVSRSWSEVVSVGSVGEAVKRVSRLRSTQPTSRRNWPIVPSFFFPITELLAGGYARGRYLTNKSSKME